MACIQLGFVEHRVPFATCLRSEQFPSKVGGRPAWLSTRVLPSLTCLQCDVPMSFLLQVYAPLTDDRPDAFHRTLYVFCCKKDSCRSYRVFRCQLSLHNDYFSAEPPTDDNNTDSVCMDPPLYIGCVVCGGPSKHTCSACKVAGYCSKEHQILHWKHGDHKTQCKNSRNPYECIMNVEGLGVLLPEYELVTEPEPHEALHISIDDEESDDDDDDDEESERRRMADFEATKAHLQLNTDDDDDLSWVEEAQKKHRDPIFHRFQRRTNVEPEQVIRYDEGGDPLWISDIGLPIDGIPPPCSICGSKRQFSFQVLPQLLNFISNKDNTSTADKKLNMELDWGVLCIYVCSVNCTITEDCYAEEFVWRQDVSSKGDLVDEARHQLDTVTLKK